MESMIDTLESICQQKLEQKVSEEERVLSERRAASKKLLDSITRLKEDAVIWDTLSSRLNTNLTITE